MIQNLSLSIILAIYLLLSKSVFGQPKKDTMFLYRQISKDWYHAVFIEKRQSPLYTEISRNITIDTLAYSSVIQELKDSVKKVFHYTNLNFPVEWYSLHQYKKKYYAYLPSEPYFNTYLKLADSTVTLNYFNDGCTPALLEEIKWIDSKKVRIKTRSLYPEDSLIILHFLNDSKTMSVLEFPMREEKRRFQLMVAKKNLSRFPLIVNYCPGNRCPEWNFESPNFKSLLK